MKTVRRRTLVAATLVGALSITSLANAQQTSGTPGSPGATTTISGKQLPPAESKFGGVIAEKASDSKPWWTPRVVPPKGAPNVLLIMTDDCGYPASCAPNILAKDFVIEAQVEIPDGGAEGMIVTEGGRFGGYGLFLSKGIEGIGRGHVVFLYNLLDLKRTAWEGPELKAGKHTIVFNFKYDGPGFGKAGTGELFVDGESAARKTLENTTPIMFPEDEDFDVGQDTRTGVALIEYRYDCPFKFTGKIDRLTFDLGPVQYTEADRNQLPAIADRVARAKD